MQAHSQSRSENNQNGVSWRRLLYYAIIMHGISSHNKIIRAVKQIVVDRTMVWDTSGSEQPRGLQKVETFFGWIVPRVKAI